MDERAVMYSRNVPRSLGTVICGCCDTAYRFDMSMQNDGESMCQFCDPMTMKTEDGASSGAHCTRRHAENSQHPVT